jgi:hypothetical protein
MDDRREAQHAAFRECWASAEKIGLSTNLQIERLS